MSDSPVPPSAALDVLTRYYAAFNAGDHAGMLELLTEDVAHDTNQGGRETGRDAFAVFLGRMQRCYAEQLVDLVLWADPTGTRAAAEFTVLGTLIWQPMTACLRPRARPTACRRVPFSRCETARSGG